MAFTPLLTELIDALRVLPGVGQKSAQRMAFALLERHRDGAKRLASQLELAVEGIGQCDRCQMFSETALCPICVDPARDDTKLCIVESPADVLALDAATGFRGRYFVLMGHLSPLDGIGPEELGLDKLVRWFDGGMLKEVIIATNPTVEGDATAHFVADMATRKAIGVSRIAHGVPVGGELEFVDGGTLSHAFTGRRAMS